jgi:hypothetical protein
VHAPELFLQATSLVVSLFIDLCPWLRLQLRLTCFEDYLLCNHPQDRCSSCKSSSLIYVTASHCHWLLHLYFTSISLSVPDSRHNHSNDFTSAATSSPHESLSEPKTDHRQRTSALHSPRDTPHTTTGIHSVPVRRHNTGYFEPRQSHLTLRHVWPFLQSLWGE